MTLPHDPAPASWVCAYVLGFEDGTAEGRALTEGTKEECERVSQLINAVAYSGEKKVASSDTYVMPAAEWRALGSETYTPAPGPAPDGGCLCHYDGDA